MSDLSPLLGEKRRLGFRAIRAAFDPERTSDPTLPFLFFSNARMGRASYRKAFERRAAGLTNDNEVDND
jgi:hypothetical protein